VYGVVSCRSFFGPRKLTPFSRSSHNARCYPSTTATSLLVLRVFRSSGSSSRLRLCPHRPARFEVPDRLRRRRAALLLELSPPSPSSALQRQTRRSAVYVLFHCRGGPPPAVGAGGLTYYRLASVVLNHHGRNFLWPPALQWQYRSPRREAGPRPDTSSCRCGGGPGGFRFVRLKPSLLRPAPGGVAPEWRGGAARPSWYVGSIVARRPHRRFGRIGRVRNASCVTVKRACRAAGWEVRPPPRRIGVLLRW